MEAQAKIVDITRDYPTGKFRVTLEFESVDVQAVNKLVDKLLTAVLKPYHKKRSLNANAYCWELCTRIAEILGTSKDEIYEYMVQRYGAVVREEDGKRTIFTAAGNIDVHHYFGDYHPKYIGDGHTNGKLFKHYVLLKGSSKCDTKEMSVLLDGIVSECKELGIETKTPDELERIKMLWKGEKE